MPLPDDVRRGLIISAVVAVVSAAVIVAAILLMAGDEPVRNPTFICEAAAGGAFLGFIVTRLVLVSRAEQRKRAEHDLPK